MDLNQLKNEVSKVDSQKSLEALRVKYFGKKGEISSLFKELAKLSKPERARRGKELNELKNKAEKIIKERKRD